MAIDGDNTDIVTKKRRNEPKREKAEREIRRLLVDEGLTKRQIVEHLHIPPRTVDRYLHEIYSDDNQLLISPSIEELALRTTVLIEQLSQQRQLVLTDIIKNSDVDPADKIEAHHLAAEIARIVWKLQ